MESAAGPPSCAYFVSNADEEEQGCVPWKLVPAGGELAEPLYLAKPKNRGKTSGWYWDAQQMHARLGTADNATNRYAVYFVRGPDGSCLCVPADTDLDKCHPALLHHDGTFTRFAQSGVQSAALRLTVPTDGKLSFKLHSTASATRRPSSSLGKGADARLHGELKRLAQQAVPGGLPPLQDGMLLILVRIGSLPLTDVAACAGDGQSSLMWRLGVTIPKPTAKPAPKKRKGAAAAAAEKAPQVIQAVSPCFAVKTDESRDIICCTVVPSLQPPPGAQGVLRASLAPRAAEGGKGTKKEALQQQPFVSLLVPGGGKDSAKKAPSFVLGGATAPLPPPQAIPTGTQTGAVHDAASGGALVFSIHSLIQGAYTPGMPGSPEARQCEAALWLWPWQEALRNITEASPGWSGTKQATVDAPAVAPPALHHGAAWGSAGAAGGGMPPPHMNMYMQGGMQGVQVSHWSAPPPGASSALSSASPLVQFSTGAAGRLMNPPGSSSVLYAPSTVRMQSGSSLPPLPPQGAAGPAPGAALPPSGAFKRQRSADSGHTEEDMHVAKVLHDFTALAAGAGAVGGRQPSGDSTASSSAFSARASVQGGQKRTRA